MKVITLVKDNQECYTSSWLVLTASSVFWKQGYFLKIYVMFCLSILVLAMHDKFQFVAENSYAFLASIAPRHFQKLLTHLSASPSFCWIAQKWVYIFTPQLCNGQLATLHVCWVMTPHIKQCPLENTIIVIPNHTFNIRTELTMGWVDPRVGCFIFIFCT